MFTLRTYQKQSLAALQRYLADVHTLGADVAFYKATNRAYHRVPSLPALPYVCVRVPTGGGKTLMACHTLKIVAESYLHQERLLCVWLVPSKAIRDQTIAALRSPAHPYRQALDEAFGRVTVLTLTEALSVQRTTLQSETVIVVTTMASLRVTDQEGRKVYEAAGALHHHFAGLDSVTGQGLERSDGVLVPSLANVLRLWHPLLIVDEAHNARTELSFETLERMAPSCIVEFTATPQIKAGIGKFPSNVISQVNAAQLKAEQMIKLPIRLHLEQERGRTLALAVETQRGLEAAAEQEQRATGEYIRPIVLIQAQRKDAADAMTAEKVKAHLMEEIYVPAAEIAIATGEVRELEGVNLAGPTSPIRFIITQQALKEGWDCPFAYVLCSVADVRSARDVEQLLGRVLRLPNTRWKQHAELNQAYAYVSSMDFQSAAAGLTDALVESGFETIEAKEFVVADQPDDNLGPLFELKTEVTIEEAPDLSALGRGLRERVAYDEESRVLRLSGDFSAAETAQIERCFTLPHSRTVVRAAVAGARLAPPRPPEEAMQVPALCIRRGGQLHLLDESDFLDSQWSLDGCRALLDAGEFPDRIGERQDIEVDVTTEGQVRSHYVEAIRQQLALLRPELRWTRTELIVWLDQRIPHPDLRVAEAQLFIGRALDALIRDRSLSLDHLVGERFRLRESLERLIDEHRTAMRSRTMQRMLDGLFEAEIVVSPQKVFTLRPEEYAPTAYYNGRFAFKKHAFPVIGAMGEGEELECAIAIEGQPAVKRWVRNIVDARNGFWIGKPTGRFYPDFVAELHDGRYLAVEYKGGHLESADDARLKRDLGGIWERQSQGLCLFDMPTNRNWNTIHAKLQS